MTASLATLRTAVAADLRDASNVDWSTAQVDRAIQQAVREYSEALPQQLTKAVASVTGRTLNLSTELTAAVYDTLIRVTAAEYPLSQWPPQYVRFNRWGATLTLHVETALAAEAVTLSYEATHTLDGSTSTIPARDAELVQLGGAGYALVQYSADAANSLAITPATAGQLRAHGERRIADFRRALRKRTPIRVGGLIRPVDPYTNPDIVTGPE